MRKYFYIIPLLLLLLCLLGPVVYTGKVSKTDAPPAAAGDMQEADPAPRTSKAGSSLSVSAGSGVSVETGSSGRPSSETAPAGQTRGDGEGLPGPGPSPASEKDTSLLPTAEPSSEGVTVNVAVVGKSGELLFGPAAVVVSKKNPWGATALGALDATGLPYEMSAGWSCFVEAVAGQRNKGQAGWMYKVNEEIPVVAADEKPVAANDKVIWWYSKSIDAPPPTWPELVKSN